MNIEISDPGAPLEKVVRELEEIFIRKTLEHCGESRELAAVTLEISMATLYRKMSSGDKRETRKHCQ